MNQKNKKTARIRAEKIQKSMLPSWFRDNGDNTLRLDYPLAEDSIVFDLGGYLGDWSQQISERYNPYIYVFEPVPQFYSRIVERFLHNPKIKVFNFGLFDKTKTETLALDNDGSSVYGSNGEKIEVSLVDIDQFLEEQGITEIDLIKINIEGAEYRLLRRMLDKGIVEKCRDIQVQFHTFYPEAEKNREEFRTALRKTHSLTYDYPFVWENWRLKNVFMKKEVLPASMSENRLIGIIFSKDRAMQLDATLRSFFLHCKDSDSVNLKVLYITSNQSYEQQYEQLKDEYESVEFVKETSFKKDLMSLLSSKQYVLFLVDDNIFIRKFCISDVLESLDNNPDVLGFSLRLGKNTTYCYMLNVEQKLPSFSELGRDILKYEWISANHDLGYPLEVSSSVYRISDIHTLLLQTDFSNPNTLELVLDRKKHSCRPSADQLLCYQHSVTFCNPVNVVQALWQNKAGKKFAYSTRKLSEVFSDGKRINVEKYATITPNACHYEVDFDFVKTDPLVSIITVNFNGLKHLRLCLESIERNTYERHEIIVVDNASSDGSRAYLRSLRHIVLVENRTNVGCPPARNQAVALAGGDFVVFLDNDTIVTPGWLTAFIKHARQHPEIGLLGPCSNFVSGPQLVRSVPYTEPDGIDAFARDFSKKNKNLLRSTHRLVGFCMFIRREVINKIGAHDPQFGKFGFEDEDFTWRAIIAGYQVAIAQDVFIHHTGGPQLRGDREYNTRLMKAWDIFKRKWELPPDLPLRPGLYIEEVLQQPFDPVCHYVPAHERCEVEALVYTHSKSRNTEERSRATGKETHVRLIVWSPSNPLADDVKRCLSYVKRFPVPSADFSVVAVNIEAGIYKDSLNVKMTSAPSLEIALQEALNSGVKHIALLSTDVIVTKHWLKKLMEVANSDASIAAVGPTSNRAPSPQKVKKGYKSIKKELQKFAIRRARKFRGEWKEVLHLGGFCLLLSTQAAHCSGGFEKGLPTLEGLSTLFDRFRANGFKVVCAKDVYVHHCQGKT